MDHLHLSRDLLDEVFKGERDPGELVPLVLKHLLELCPDCQGAFETWQQDCSLSNPESDTPFEGIPHHVESSIKRMHSETLAAQDAVKALAAMSAEQRLEVVEGAPETYHGVALGRLLIETSRASMPAKPHESLAFAQLARTVLEHTEFSPFVGELYARSVAYVANAWRVIGKLPEASEAMAHARFILKAESGSDVLVRAEIDNLEGLIRLHQRRFDVAERLLRRAVQSFSSVGQEQEVVRSEINLAIIYRESGESGKAAERYTRLLARLEANEPDRMQLYLRKNLAVCLCDLGRYEEAQEALQVVEPLFAQYGDDLTRLRMIWIEGLIAFGKGDLELAASQLSTVCHGFAKRDLSFDTALSCLDLARIYLVEGRVREVQRIAADLVPLFAEQEVYREAYAALVLFQDAAALSRVSLQLVDRLATYLVQCQRDPSFAFQRTS